jgi:diguanylate cyclase (GGDEF)-like protein
MTSLSPRRPRPLQPTAELTALREEVERLRFELDRAQEQIAQLEDLAYEDPLTRVLNRRGFLRDLDRALAYRERHGIPIALMLVDLDGFKPINDRFGHDVGDCVLKHVAELMAGHVRRSDSVGRLGGDEFGLILWQVEEGPARHKAEALEALLVGNPYAAASCGVTCGASIGAVLLADGDTPEAALIRADRAMYARKSAKRAVRR